MLTLTKNQKISKTLKEKYGKSNNCKCATCGSEIYRKPSKLREVNFCCVSCSTTWKNKNIGMGSLGGKASVESQKNSRRSLNEIYFANLCKKEFSILENEAIFNGWDADIILTDEKIAVLWNGKWHYEKITEKHSVDQVQNRDRIKIKEIEKAGYVPYIIKDLGRHDPTFVEEQFLIMKKTLNIPQ